MKSKKVKSQEEEEFVPKAFKKEKSNVTQENKKSRRGKTNKNKKVKKIIISLIVSYQFLYFDNYVLYKFFLSILPY